MSDESHLDQLMREIERNNELARRQQTRILSARVLSPPRRRSWLQRLVGRWNRAR